MGKALLIAMALAAVVFGGLMFINHANTNSFQNVNANFAASPTPMHLVIASPSSALAQQAPSPTPEPATVPGPVASISATVETSKGNIVLTLFTDAAPKAVANFVQKAKSGYYNGLDFHRVENWVIQGGDPLGNGTGGKDMTTELNSKPFITGSLGVAAHPGPNGQNINNDSQFFITKTDASWLNGQYTNFGIVTSGMDVVDKIQIGDKILGIIIQ